MTPTQLNEIFDINTAMISQCREQVRNDAEWENESKNAQTNYAAGYAAALEFVNSNLTRIERNEPLHHLELEQKRQRRNMSINDIKKEAGEHLLDPEYWNEPY